MFDRVTVLVSLKFCWEWEGHQLYLLRIRMALTPFTAYNISALLDLSNVVIMPFWLLTDNKTTYSDVSVLFRTSQTYIFVSLKFDIWNKLGNLFFSVLLFDTQYVLTFLISQTSIFSYTQWLATTCIQSLYSIANCDPAVTGINQ